MLSCRAGKHVQVCHVELCGSCYQGSPSPHRVLRAHACTLLTPFAGCFCRHCYSEHLAYLPNCYFVNDYKSAHMDVLDEPNLPTRYVTFTASRLQLYVCPKMSAH